ncbi:MAG: hypothetical protein ACD_17C00013G0002 [uncultured bacterium]|nr:MAG: hypothetical protein ACD_17C00013G0002 [uncultured bacterium]OGN56077.1 MAG: hypothetical protein A2796_04020 [Chlamydiae bacterium RIFCSPHIGHO2_01_FULL_44_39]OGN60909.1 MAG: hypothetical protein A3D96_00015 [Chlamydiae bacterium RIFCSPHIGHO2_12_FULL_44_59]OGN66509.1 MAG: hypothetical protein A2978_05490 [Chlamydiae bacterium RIFCSPLOWO2_01_FULL_44_52]OGN69552.1 MAG: hypothetical protein A3I67_00910 [Chlamydiae bacterium RIFCSPLOWO2_02_FULL_45_22]OGN70828.1 MAG: hypothetical protein A3
MKGLLFQIGICLSVFGMFLYVYLEKQNELTELKIRLPEVEKAVRLIQEENRRLAFEIDQFENPAHLIEIAHYPEYGHLKHPLLKEILTVPEALATTE